MSPADGNSTSACVISNPTLLFTVENSSVITFAIELFVHFSTPCSNASSSLVGCSPLAPWIMPGSSTTCPLSFASRLRRNPPWHFSLYVLVSSWAVSLLFWPFLGTKLEPRPNLVVNGFKCLFAGNDKLKRPYSGFCSNTSLHSSVSKF